LKIFLDTNVLVSSFITRGLCADLFRIIVAEHELILSDYILSELETVLDQKINLPPDQIQDIIKYLKSFLVIKNHTPPVEIILRDKNDIPVLAAALNSNSDFLVTGDKDLLEVNQAYSIKIVSPKEFFQTIKSK
jgi:uncharacterized protein